MIRLGYPAEDLAGYTSGTELPLHLLAQTRGGEPFALRHYQQDAADIFYAGGQVYGGSGVVVLPCGAGKTMVGMAAMAQVQQTTLILTPSTVAARQWKSELLDKTDLREEDIGEYTGQAKEIRPVTLTTYQILIYRKRKGSLFPHFALINDHDWGLIIYDEVHLLPAPVFRITAEIQARRRLGLTATLVREDGQEEEVFALIGPKKYDVPWKDLERQGWIATAECHEIRIPLPDDHARGIRVRGLRFRRLRPGCRAHCLPAHALCHRRSKNQDRHRRQQSGQAPDPQRAAAQASRGLGLDHWHLPGPAQIGGQGTLDLPLITGKTPVRQRERLFAQLRDGDIQALVISKVGNFSIDLPDVNVAIQLSGSFGSRQEEAQRLGRILRPKRNGLLAHFYTLVSQDTREQEFAARRQLFLTEQGYRYEILYDYEVADYEPALLALLAEERKSYLVAPL